MSLEWELRAFECTLAGDDGSTIIHEMTPGRAKSKFFLRLSDYITDAEFTDVRCKCLGAPITDRKFTRVAKYRHAPWARVGSPVEVFGCKGLVVGVSVSATFDVLFLDGKYTGQTLNCHPGDIDWCGAEMQDGRVK